MTDLHKPITEETVFTNFRLDLRYDGQHYFGWQRHEGKATIQGAVEDAVTECFGVRQNLEGAGRTDRGTHANGQVATIRLPENIDTNAALITLNQILGKNIEITHLVKAPPSFHARSTALGKRYLYKIWNHEDLPPELDGKVWYIPEELNVAAMGVACPYFEGTLDFASFAKVPNYKRASTERTVHSLKLIEKEPCLCFSIIGDGFLYKMVRNIVRSLVKVGEERLRPRDIPKIIEAKSRKAAPGTAPASGLYLDAVYYDEQSKLAAIAKDCEIQEGLSL